jgi:nucleoside-diphosphate-sugar epimerase
MKVFVAGATGAIGKRLIPLLVQAGHQVTGTTRNPGKGEALRNMGAEAVIVEGLDRDAVVQSVLSIRPEVIVHQMTALASMKSLKNFDAEFALTNRLRTEGTENLIAAARAAGVRKIIAQSYTGWPYARQGGRIKTEDDPLDPHPPKAMSESLAAIRKLENLVTTTAGFTGIVLRYGSLYGPGTSTSRDGEIVQLIRQRKFPLAGSGAGVWSFIHVDDAASATLAAVESDARGIFNVVDDDPAEVSVWLPALAERIGAKPPRHVPAWLGRLFVGAAGLSMMTQSRGASNAKAKRVLGWTPKYASWRAGFRSF